MKRNTQFEEQVEAYCLSQWNEYSKMRTICVREFIFTADERIRIVGKLFIASEQGFIVHFDEDAYPAILVGLKNKTIELNWQANSGFTLNLR